MVAQRWLLVALLLVFLASAGLFWWLCADTERGGGSLAAPSNPTSSTAARALEDVALATPDAPAPPAETDAARAALAAEIEAPTLVAVDAESFDAAGIYGRVLHAGVGVADVELRVFAAELDRRERRLPLAETQSDAAGRFRLSGLEPLRRYALHAQHPSFLPREESAVPGRALELVLEPAVAVHGRVRSAASEAPLADVGIGLDAWHWADGAFRERVFVRSDAEGRWQLPWAEEGMESFLVLRAGHLPERREFQVRPGAGEYEIRLAEALGPELELVAFEDGARLIDTEVLWEGTPLCTDARGRLRTQRPAANDEGLRASLALPGGCVTQLRGAPGASAALLRVPLARGGRVHGRVLDAAGVGVAGAQVRLTGGRVPPIPGLPEGMSLAAPRVPVRSGPDGAYELVGLPPREGSAEVLATHPEHPSGRSEPFDFRSLGEVHAADVTLAAGATLEGTLRLDGEPAALRLFYDGDESSGWTESNARGAYRLRGLASGRFTLRPRSPKEDEDQPRPEDREVFVADGETRVEDFDLVSRNARILGRVVDALGAPVPEAEVSAEVSTEDGEAEFAGAYAECDHEGRFELLVPDGPGLAFDLYAWHGARRTSAEGVRAGAELELVLPAPATLALSVVDALRREPVLGFQLYWRESANGNFERLSQGGRRLSPGPDGSFLAELPAGRLDLAVGARAQGFVPQRVDGVELESGRTHALELVLETGTDLELELSLPPDAPDVLRQLQRGRVVLATAAQWAERERGGELFQQEVQNAQAVRIDAAGLARVRALASGRYRLHGLPKGIRAAPLELEVAPVGQLRLRVALEREKPEGAGD
jgi:hypothetical protein